MGRRVCRPSGALLCSALGSHHLHFVQGKRGGLRFGAPPGLAATQDCPTIRKLTPMLDSPILRFVAPRSQFFPVSNFPDREAAKKYEP